MLTFRLIGVPRTCPGTCLIVLSEIGARGPQITGLLTQHSKVTAVRAERNLANSRKKSSLYTLEPDFQFLATG